jgi:hypothetical protein
LEVSVPSAMNLLSETDKVNDFIVYFHRYIHTKLSIVSTVTNEIQNLNFT